MTMLLTPLKIVDFLMLLVDYLFSFLGVGWGVVIVVFGVRRLLFFTHNREINIS